MSIQETRNKIKKNQISPIYLLYGTESYFIQNLKNALTEQVLSGSTEDLSVYDLQETPVEVVIGDAETIPFFGEKKLIIANNPVFVKGKPDKLAFEHKLEVLEEYLQSPVDFSILVFVAPYEKMDERKKIVKQLKKHAEVVDCGAIKDQDLTTWIRDLAESLNITIADEAYEIFESELAADLKILENEIKKLSLYVGEGGIVTKEIAEELVARTPESSALRLVDAVIEKDLYTAISVSRDLSNRNEEPIALIGLLAFQFRAILRVKLLKQKGYTQFQMQKKLNIHPYVIKIALRREKQFSTRKLEHIMNRLAEADTMMKRGTMEKKLAFELLIHDLI